MKYTTKWSKPYGYRDERLRFRATVSIENGYFSATGEEYTDVAIEGEHIEIIDGEEWYNCASGCLHESILEHFPELKMFVDLHLSSSDRGIPMHSVSNGASFVRDKKWDVLQRHLRLTDDELASYKASLTPVEEIAKDLEEVLGLKDIASYMPHKMALFLKENGVIYRWHLEADNARVELERLIAEQKQA